LAGVAPLLIAWTIHLAVGILFTFPKIAFVSPATGTTIASRLKTSVA
jgi:hypothetical protein